MPQNAANFKSTPLVDVRPFGLDGRIAADWLEQVGLTINKNAIPFDPLPPSKASGIRVGTPATTTRGMREPEMRDTAALIDEAIVNRTDESRLAELRSRVSALTARFPIYTGLVY